MFVLCSQQRAPQKANWSGYPIIGHLNYGNKHHNNLHLVPSWQKINTWNQTPLPSYDHQKCIHTLMQLKKYFSFEVQVLDDKNVRRRFRASNYQSTTRVKPFICTMPMRLDEGTLSPNQGWNQIQFNLSDFTRRAYGSNYI